VVADVRRLPFADGAFDVVTASLFLHHFDEEGLPAILAGLHRLARRALVVNDLHRAIVPYLFGRAAFPLLFRSRVSVEDGLLSIRRGFRAGELRAAFARAGLPTVTIRRQFPYRLLAVAASSSVTPRTSFTGAFPWGGHRPMGIPGKRSTRPVIAQGDPRSTRVGTRDDR
jgi:hypothetical protein